MKGFVYVYIEFLKWDLKNMVFFLKIIIKIFEIDELDFFFFILNYFVYFI